MVEAANYRLIGYSAEAGGSCAALEERLNQDTDALLEEAGVDGSLPEEIELNDGFSVYRLIYKTGGKLIVTYIKGNDPEYQVTEETSALATGSAPSILASLTSKLEGVSLTAAEITRLYPPSEYLELYGDNGLLKTSQKSQLLQLYYQYLNGGESYVQVKTASLPESIQEKMSSATQDTDVMKETIYWAPVYTSDGEVLMVATKSSSRQISGGFKTALVYYEGAYYYHIHSAGSSMMNAAYVSDQIVTIDSSINSNVWVKVE